VNVEAVELWPDSTPPLVLVTLRNYGALPALTHKFSARWCRRAERPPAKTEFSSWLTAPAIVNPGGTEVVKGAAQEIASEASGRSNQIFLWFEMEYGLAARGKESTRYKFGAI
jgi:hypothetical protein